MGNLPSKIKLATWQQHKNLGNFPGEKYHLCFTVYSWYINKYKMESFNIWMYSPLIDCICTAQMVYAVSTWL